MTTALRVLVIEDVPDEAELMVRQLSQAGLALDWTRVETEAEYLTALGTLPDLILADWRLPHFSGLRALHLMRERGLDIPFVIVSGSIGEEAAVDAMRQGAYDYVLKDRPARLGQAVEHALGDKQQREERRHAEAALRESEERYRTLFNEMPVGLYRTSIDGRILEANPALAALFGYDSPHDLIGTNVRELYADPEGRLPWSESVASDGLLLDAEIRVRRKDGLLIWARDSGRTVRDQSGRPIYFEGTLSDITERKEAEQALRESEERYRLLAENMADSVWLMDMDLRVTYISPSVIRARGFTLEETNAIPFEQQATAESFARAMQLLSQALSRDAPGAPASTELEFYRKDGTTYWSETSFVLIREADGTPRSILGVGRDITERKAAEGRLQRSEISLRMAQQVAHVGSWIWHFQENRLEWSEEMARIFGHDPSAVSGDLSQVIASSVHPEDREAFDRANEALAREQRPLPMEYRILRPDGEVRTLWAEGGDLILDDAGRPWVLTGIVQDITERRLAEQVLRESEERYRKLVELSPDSIGIHCEGKVVYVNPAALALFHAHRPEDLVGLPVIQLIDPEYRAIAMERVRRSYEEGLPAPSLEEKIVTLDGHSIDVEISGGPVTHEGKPATQIIIRDITERKRAEQALRESEQRYRAVIDSASDAIISADGAGTIVGWNHAAERMFGYTESELTGQPLARLLPAHHLSGYLAGMERLQSSGEAEILGRTLEAEGQRKDGQIFPLELSLSEWRVAEERFYTAIIRDITERKRAEEGLRKRVNEMGVLYQTSLEILAGNDLPTLLGAIVERAERLTGGDRGALYLLTLDGKRIRVHISHHLEADYTGTELEIGEGVAGRAAEARRATMIEDYATWQGKSPKFLDGEVGRVLAVPMLVGDRLIGVLNVADRKTGSYGEDDIRLAGMFADQAAMVVERARLVSETNRRAAYLEALTNTAAALRAAAKPREMYADILGLVVDQLKAFGAILALADPESGGTEIVLAVGAWQGTTGMRLSAGEGIVGMVASTGRTFVSDDIRGDPRLAHPEVFQDLPAIACVPLTVEDQIVGCVMVGRREPLSAEEVQLLTGLAEISANAISRMQVMETLEMRVRQRTRELEAANERLQELDRLKTDFVSNVTHELRTPITNIVLYLDLARRTESEVKRSHYFNVLGSESVRLGGLIEEVLTLSRLERRAVPMDREPHPLDSLLADVRVAHQVRADTKGVRLEHDLDPSLPVASINRSQIHQVLTNLVANAVAYTPPGGQVHLGTARSEVGGREYVGMVVHNTGTVIAAEDQAHLFERFYRGRIGRASGEPGTGLGLAISKEIVELHHGWIDVESSEQGGTTFTAWLPAGPQA